MAPPRQTKAPKEEKKDPDIFETPGGWIFFGVLSMIVPFVSSGSFWWFLAGIGAIVIGFIWMVVRAASRPIRAGKQYYTPPPPPAPPPPAPPSVQIEPPLSQLPAITPLPSTFFDAQEIRSPEQPLPVPTGEILSIGKDQKLLTDYATYLESHRKEIDTLHTSVIERFTTDYENVRKQQKMALRRCNQAARVTARFTDLPQFGNSFLPHDLPEYQKLSLPAPPKYKTPTELSATYTAPVFNMGQVGGQLHKYDAATALVMLAGIIATEVISAKTKISKFLRVLEDIKGQITLISEETKESIQSIGRGHTQLVDSSNALFKANAEIEALVQRALQIPSTNTTISSLSENQRTTILALNTWIVVAGTLGSVDAH